jgi:hypothetical protein
VILYRKAASLRIRRTTAPASPFWAATTIAPYGPKRTTPVAIDLVSLRASGADKLEVTVTENVRDELDRARMMEAPVLIDAAGSAEDIFCRGEEAMRWCAENGIASQLILSTSLIVRLVDATRWGIGVPVIFPITTDLGWLESQADQARRDGAAFFAAIPIEVDPTAKQAIAQSMELAADDDRYSMLFHGDVGPVQLATERHIAALAAERDMADFVVPPQWDQRSNWNAAVLLTLTASRMIAMELDLDLAGTIARSARTVAELDKPLSRIAEAASLSIVGGLDETSVELLSQWLAGEAPAFAEYVNEQWRMRRGGMSDG